MSPAQNRVLLGLGGLKRYIATCYGLMTGWAMARRVKVRVPNPDKPAKGRLDAPPAKPHRNAKKYRRRPKHQGRDEVE